MKDIASAVTRAAQGVHVPGTPLTLRLERVESTTDVCRLWWSYRDPTGEYSDGRVRGETSVDIGTVSDADVGALCWDAAQLAAAHRWKDELDGDEMPGVPYEPRTWTEDEAWEALLSLLGRYGAVVESEGPDGPEVTLDSAGELLVLRLERAQWAAHLKLPDEVSSDDIVPTAVALVDGLPLWVSDEIIELLGTTTGVVTLVDGELRSLSGW